MIGRPLRKSIQILKIRLRGKDPQVPQTTSDLTPKKSDINNKSTDNKSRYPQINWAVKPQADFTVNTSKEPQYRNVTKVKLRSLR